MLLHFPCTNKKPQIISISCLETACGAVLSPPPPCSMQARRMMALLNHGISGPHWMKSSPQTFPAEKEMFPLYSHREPVPCCALDTALHWLDRHRATMGHPAPHNVAGGLKILWMLLKDSKLTSTFRQEDMEKETSVCTYKEYKICKCNVRNSKYRQT